MRISKLTDKVQVVRDFVYRLKTGLVEEVVY